MRIVRTSSELWMRSTCVSVCVHCTELPVSIFIDMYSRGDGMGMLQTSSELCMCFNCVVVCVRLFQLSVYVYLQTCIQEEMVCEYYRHLQSCVCASTVWWCACISLSSLFLYIYRYVFKRRGYENSTDISGVVDVLHLCVGVCAFYLAPCLYIFIDMHTCIYA